MKEHLASIVCGALSSLLATFVAASISAWAPPKLHHAPPLPMIGHLQPAPGQSLPVSAFEPTDPVALHRYILDRSNLLATPELYQGQVYQESRYVTDAVSPAGAVGPAQFLRATWEKDVRPRLPARCADAPRTDPECSFLGQVEYKRLIDQWMKIKGDHDVLLAAYNAGVGSIGKEQAACAMRPGCNPSRWDDSLEHVCLRGSAACSETRNYIPRIHKASRQFTAKATESGFEAGFSWSF